MRIADWRLGRDESSTSMAPEHRRNHYRWMPIGNDRLTIGSALGGLAFASSVRVNAKALELQARTQAFYQRVIKLTQSLPDNRIVDRIAPQLLDAAGSADSNYRSACRGRTTREFIAKLGVAAEEADEAKGWLESLFNAGIGDSSAISKLIQEAHELVAIFTASERTARRNLADSEAKDKRHRRK